MKNHRIEIEEREDGKGRRRHLNWIILGKCNEAFAINPKYYDIMSRSVPPSVPPSPSSSVKLSAIKFLPSWVFPCASRKSIIYHLWCVSTIWNYSSFMLRLSKDEGVGWEKADGDWSYSQMIIFHKIFNVGCRQVQRFSSLNLFTTFSIHTKLFHFNFFG